MNEWGEAARKKKVFRFSHSYLPLPRSGPFLTLLHMKPFLSHVLIILLLLAFIPQCDSIPQITYSSFKAPPFLLALLYPS